VPLRSVEAATRDDAIAAAREQFGPSARVVGVRRVRSGGVLGFFATERYVAEVAPEQSSRPGVPAPSSAHRTSPSDTHAPSASPESFSSPLASAAPARARTTAPARNGAAAWAAEARSAEPARSSSPRATAPRSADPDALIDEARVNELVGLLAAAPVDQPEPASPRTSVPRASFPRAGRITSLVDDEEQDEAVHHGPVVPASAAPNPFTAALARMVAGDRDVRQAVQEALEQPAATSSRSAAGPWPTWPESIGSADSVSSPATRQEEETVGDLVIAPSSMTAAAPVEVPTWVAEPEVTAPADPSREEAIAEILRSALAQGHSDEALAGILRKVLDGASPQTALVEPAPVPLVPAAAPAPVPPAAVARAAAFVSPVVDAAPVPVAEPLVETPVAVSAPAAPAAAAPAPAPAEDLAPAAVDPTWAASPLWAETGPAMQAPVVATDAPIWAEVVLQEPASSTVRKPKAEAAPVAVPASGGETPAEPVVEPTVEAAAEVTEEVAEEVAEEPVEELVATAEATRLPEETVAAAEQEEAELAPVLARTASDPAPMTMSLDATTVMPPLSLIPPLPGSRPRGLPPVPPSSSRTAPSSPGAGTSTRTSDTMTDSPAPVTAARSLATVTRLPVAPLMATPETPELAGMSELSEGGEPARAALPVAPVPAKPAAQDTRPATSPRTPAEITARLEALGLPAELLGTTFGDDVAREGTYAALTRTLGLRLAQPPRLPSGAGEVLFVVGPGIETLRTARALAASLRLDPDRVQWASRGELAGLAPESSRMTTVDVAIDRRQEATAALTATIVAVDAPLRTDAYWMAQMLAIWSPDAVWAIVEATRKPEDLLPWIDGLSRVDALIVQDTDLSADPAAVLRQVAAPVALLDGVRATPHRWASLLCERLESASE
jgi:hypothetical protein